MNDKAGDCFDLIAAFMDDPERDFCTSDYLRPFLQQAQMRLFENVFNNPNIGGAKFTVELFNVPAGTTSLDSYFQAGQPLELLTGIFTFKEKQSGQPITAYRPMRPAWDIPIYTTATGQPLPLFNETYVIAHGTVLLPGASQNMDLRIFGMFKPAKIADDDSMLIPNTTTVLAHWATELLAATRGASEIYALHKADRMAATEELFNNQIMLAQEITNQQRPFDISGGSTSYSFFA